MYACPGCGSMMRFDIMTQQLKCEYCGSSVDPKSHPQAAADAKHESYDMTVYSCPQCGGEIMAGENEATGFCTYCGAVLELDGRLTEQLKPHKIIPFKVTKDECKKNYAAATKKVWCMPKALTDADKLEKFRGIYLPYWVYQAEQKGPVRISGSRTSGNYEERCHINFNLNANYDWLIYDASSSFADDLSEAILPFDKQKAEDFSTAYLSGFFADIADVNCDVYMEDAIDEANDLTTEGIPKQGSGLSGMHIDKIDDPTTAYHTELTAIKRAMAPVWFLTWRDRDRVAYAAVNGESGKVVADYPVDRKAFYLRSLIAAAAAFVVLLMIPTMQAVSLMTWAMIFACVTAVIYKNNIRALYEKDHRTADKGFQFANHTLSKVHVKKERRSGTIKAFFMSVVMVGMIFIVLNIFSGDFSETIAFARNLFSMLTMFCALAAPIITIYSLVGSMKWGRDHKGLPVIIDILPTVVSVFAGSWLIVKNPAADLPYMIVSIVIYLCIVFTLMRMIGKYNERCMRPIPEFHHRGGDEIVQ